MKYRIVSKIIDDIENIKCKCEKKDEVLYVIQYKVFIFWINFNACSNMDTAIAIIKKMKRFTRAKNIVVYRE
jgi:hypothetical protein